MDFESISLTIRTRCLAEANEYLLNVCRAAESGTNVHDEGT